MRKILLALFLILPFFAMGCGKKADTNKSVDQIRQEVQAMSAQDLEAYAKAYASEISKQKAEVEKIASELKEIPVTQIFGEQAKSIKDRLSGVQSQVSALSERFQVYADKAREKGVNLDSVKI
jgi:hypothetical protein